MWVKGGCEGVFESGRLCVIVVSGGGIAVMDDAL